MWEIDLRVAPGLPPGWGRDRCREVMPAVIEVHADPILIGPDEIPVIFIGFFPARPLHAYLHSAAFVSKLLKDRAREHSCDQRKIDHHPRHLLSRPPP